jgi:hypothetical protein
VILVEGHEYYFGNDTYKQPQDCKDPAIAASGQPCRIVKVAAGVYTVIRGALEAPGAKDDEIPSTISRAGPPGSKGALIIYSAGAEKKYEGDLKNLSADKIGDQRAQEGKTSREFVAGLQAAQQVLSKIGTNRKALFIFSDGFDAGSAEEMTAIKKKLDADKVEVFAFYLEASTDFIPDDANTLKTSKNKLDILAGGPAVKAKDQDALKVAITAAVTQLNSRYSLVFPGQIIDPKTKRKAGFKWDGQEHSLTLKLGDGEPIPNVNSQGEEVPTLLVLAPKWGQAAGGSLWWLWVAIPGGVLLIGILIAALGGKKAPGAGAGDRAAADGRGARADGLGAVQPGQDHDGEHLERRRPAGRRVDRADPGREAVPDLQAPVRRDPHRHHVERPHRLERWVHEHRSRQDRHVADRLHVDGQQLHQRHVRQRAAHPAPRARRQRHDHVRQDDVQVQDDPRHVT